MQKQASVSVHFVWFVVAVMLFLSGWISADTSWRIYLIQEDAATYRYDQDGRHHFELKP